MKKIILLSFLGLNISLLHCQDLNLDFSELSYDVKIIKAAGLIGNRIYQVHGDEDNMYLLIYDLKDYKKVGENNFKQKRCKKSYCIDKHFDYKKTIFLKDRIIIFFETYEKTSETKMLLAHEFDLNGAFVGKLVEVDKLASGKRDYVIFNIITSEDTTRFAVVCLPPYDKSADEKLNIKIYDSHLQNLTNMSISLPYKDKNMSLHGYTLGNNGKIYILAEILLEKEQKTEGQAGSYYVMLTIDPQNNKVSEYKLNLPSKSIKAIRYLIDKDCKNISFGGFYSELNSKQSEGDIHGFFFLTVDIVTNEVKSSTYKAINRSMLSGMSKSGKNINDLDFRNIIKRSDGSTTLIAETRCSVVGSHVGHNREGKLETERWVDYYRNNLVILNIASDGTILPLIDIFKIQESKDDNGFYSSYLSVAKDNRVFVIYNDNRDNIEKNDHSYPMPKPKKACLVATEIKNDSSFTQKIIIDNKEKKIIAVPEKGLKIGDGQYIVPVTDVGGYDYGTVRIKL